MKIVCVSASNIQHAGENSTSLKACRLIGRIAGSLASDVDTDIIVLSGHELSPCTGCGACYKTGRCASKDEFNILYGRLVSSDCIFIVSAHYAPIPSKLCMLLEKIEQLAFLKRFHDDSFRSPLFGKPAGITPSITRLRGLSRWMLRILTASMACFSR